jgi:hypothetical protein
MAVIRQFMNANRLKKAGTRASVVQHLLTLCKKKKAKHWIRADVAASSSSTSSSSSSSTSVDDGDADDDADESQEDEAPAATSSSDESDKDEDSLLAEALQAMEDDYT